jgi:hypothetical protein
MKICLLLNALIIVQLLAVEPLDPRVAPNTPRQTLPVSLHPDLTTMLVFPEPISMIVGAGLTDGATAGLVQFDHRKNSPVVTFRPLQTEQSVFAQIIAGENVYFCRLSPGEKPDSVVTIATPVGNQAVEVPIEEVFSQRLALSQERLRQFVELARSAAVLRHASPKEYENSQSLEVSMERRAGVFETRIEKIHRFPKSDILVFLGTITNKGNVPVSISENRLQLIVGQSRKLTPNYISLFNRIIGVGESAQVECVLAGDGQGNRPLPWQWELSS